MRQSWATTLNCSLMLISYTTPLFAGVLADGRWCDGLEKLFPPANSSRQVRELYSQNQVQKALHWLWVFKRAELLRMQYRVFNMI